MLTLAHALPINIMPACAPHTKLTHEATQRVYQTPNPTIQPHKHDLIIIGGDINAILQKHKLDVEDTRVHNQILDMSTRNLNLEHEYAFEHRQLLINLCTQH